VRPLTRLALAAWPPQITWVSDHDNHHPEAEIIPPGADPARWQDRRRGQGPFPGQERMWVWSNDPRYRGLRYRRPGPLGMLAIFAALAALGAIGFFVFLGAVAITLPLIAALVIVGLIGGLLRRL
jgi:hypothetical protein